MSLLDDMGHDAFRYGALDKRGLFALQVLEAAGEPLTAAEVARSCVVVTTDTTVRRVLTRAAQAGIVAKVGTRWELADLSPESLDRAAELFGTAGKRAEALARHRPRDPEADAAYIHDLWIDEGARAVAAAVDAAEAEDGGA